jgi:phosphatidylethanolamine-binding protein
MSVIEYQEALKASLTKANLVPGPAAGLIPADFRPTTKLHVRFSNKAVENGTFFRVGECKEAPKLKFAPEETGESDDENGNANASYTFIMTDPDAPTPDDPKFAFWRHWVLSGLRPQTADDPADAVAAASELTAYLGPGPKDE